MADKPTFNTFSSNSQLDVTKLNENFTTVADAIEDGLGRGGTGESPNSMSGALDMNLKKIQNVGAPSADNDAARLVDISDSDATGAASATLRSDLGSTANGKGASLIGIEDTANLFVGTTAEAALAELTGGKSVDTYTDLKALTPNNKQTIFVRGRTSAGDKGHGIFIWDSSDLSTEVTADSQEGIYVAPNSDATGASGAWVRPFSTSINVQWFGAVGDGVTDDSTAVQAAVNFAISNLIQITVYFPPSASYYVIDSINLDGNDIVIDASEAYLRNTSTNPMFIIGATTAVQFADIKINRLLSSATSGHDFDFQGDFSMSTLYVGRLTHGNPATSIIYGKNAGSQFFFNTFDGKQWNTSSASSTPAIDIAGATNICSENRFIFNRADRSGTEPFIKLNCTGAGQFFYNNKIETSWEVVNGGAVHLLGCSNHFIGNGNFYDMGTTTKDLILLSASSGNGCQNTIIQNVSRNSGTLGGSLYDINLNDADETVIINCGAHNATVGANFNINGKTATIINPTYATLTGEDTNALIINENGVSKDAPNTIETKTIASGVITASNSYHRIDTEGAAATDDLDTINGGTDGMRLILQSAANARDTTIKNGTGNIRLAGAADFTLTRITDTIELVYQTVSNEWCEVSRSDNQT